METKISAALWPVCLGKDFTLQCMRGLSGVYRTLRCQQSVPTAMRKSAMIRCLSVLLKSIMDGLQRFVAAQPVCMQAVCKTESV